MKRGGLIIGTPELCMHMLLDDSHAEAESIESCDIVLTFYQL